MQVKSFLAQRLEDIEQQLKASSHQVRKIRSVLPVSTFLFAQQASDKEVIAYLDKQNKNLMAELEELKPAHAEAIEQREEELQHLRQRVVLMEESARYAKSAADTFEARTKVSLGTNSPQAYAFTCSLVLQKEKKALRNEIKRLQDELTRTSVCPLLQKETPPNNAYSTSSVATSNLNA